MDKGRLRDGISFSPLPGTVAEASYLKENARKWNLDINSFTGSRATELSVHKLQSPYILHFATHGFFLQNMTNGANQTSSSPMSQSGLLLAGSKSNVQNWRNGNNYPSGLDGILTASEAANLNLDGTWLVALSACNTGRGDIVDGEGVMGLRRAFTQAGAQNLLMTLWPVSDKYTTDFIKAFYDRAMADGDAPQALADVQRKFLVKYREKFKDSKSATRLAVQVAGPFILSFQGNP